ncbi:MAG TPA: HNH endonuclease [Longimicrobiales bacterium]|nr:HNH endonuclease [Longimicrobiales bacterium]
MTDQANALDAAVRAAAFEFLRTQTALHGEILSRDVLSAGFQFDGQRVPLLGPQGIFKPAVLPEMPLSFTTVPPKHGAPPPYDDELGPDGLLRYRYRGTNANHHENVGMVKAMQRRVPLVYLFGIVPGKYIPTWPVYVVHADPQRLTFHVAVEDKRFGAAEMSQVEPEIRRSYVTRLALHRLHQASFRGRVLRAYREHCAICRLRHVELLEAAHILPDGHPRGEPLVANGLALCKLHHAAFDRHILGVSPDYVVHIRRDILEEIDGPMLQHGLKEMEGRKLVVVPGARDLKPRPEFLEERFDLFRKVG